MFVRVFILTVLLLALGFVGLGIQTFFSKKKKFPETHVGDNKEMRKRNITCMKNYQKILDKEANTKNDDKKCDACD